MNNFFFFVTSYIRPLSENNQERIKIVSEAIIKIKVV